MREGHRIAVPVDHRHQGPIFAEPPFRAVFEFQPIALEILIPREGGGIEDGLGRRVLQRGVQAICATRARELPVAAVRHDDADDAAKVIPQHVLGIVMARADPKDTGTAIVGAIRPHQRDGHDIRNFDVGVNLIVQAGLRIARVTRFAAIARILGLIRQRIGEFRLIGFADHVYGQPIGGPIRRGKQAMCPTAQVNGSRTVRKVYVNVPGITIRWIADAHTAVRQHPSSWDSIQWRSRPIKDKPGHRIVGPRCCHPNSA